MFARLHISRYSLPLTASWPGAGQAHHRIDGWLLTLTAPDGTRGRGDCFPLPACGTENRSLASATLAGLPTAFPTPEKVDDLLDRLHRTPAVRCALDTALLDLQCRLEGRPLRQRLHPAAANSVAVNALGGPACDARMPDPAWPVVKLKLGHRAWRRELDCLEKLVTERPGIRLRLDINGAWNQAQARAALKTLEKFPVDLVEEPLAKPGLATLTRLQAHTSLTLAMDESLHRLGVNRVLARPPVRALVVKPLAVGGLRRAFALCRRAIRAGLRVIITTAGESAVGVVATAQLAAAVEALAPGETHGLATSSWLARDLAAPPPIIGGRMVLSHQPGIGVSP